jgi:hypothetical protein
MYKMLIIAFFYFRGIGVLMVEIWIFSMYNLQLKIV